MSLFIAYLCLDLFRQGFLNFGNTGIWVLTSVYNDINSKLAVVATKNVSKQYHMPERENFPPSKNYSNRY